MTGDQIANLAFLTLLAAALAGWFFTQNRQSLGKSAQQAAVWGLIFVGVVAAAGMWSDIRQTVRPQTAVLADGRIEIPRGPDGHYQLVAEINGVPVNFVVDTGASQIVLTQEDAARVGIDVASLAFVGTALTANGPVGTANIWLDELRIGPWTETEVRAVVNEGELFQSLLGMEHLSRLARIEIADGRMILTP